MFSLVCNFNDSYKWSLRFSSSGNLVALHRSQGGGFQEHQVHRRVSLRRAHQRCQGIFQQLRNQEEGWVGACGQVQQINIGPRGSQSWRRNERPSFLPTSAQTWKYLLVHAKLLYLGNHSCILAEILVDLRQWGPSGERRGWGGWRGRGGRWGQGSWMWNNVMYTQVLKMMLNLPTLYEKTW